MRALEMIQVMNTDAALDWHLQSNHFPPVSLAFKPACIEAIQACDQGEAEKEITLPNGRVKSAFEIVEELHLQDFLQQGD